MAERWFFVEILFRTVVNTMKMSVCIYNSLLLSASLDILAYNHQ
jgi:hypothetical protein